MVIVLQSRNRFDRNAKWIEEDFTNRRAPTDKMLRLRREIHRNTDMTTRIVTGNTLEAIRFDTSNGN